VFPLSKASFEKEKVFKNKCVGKAISDSVEAMIGALYLTAANPMRESKTGETGLYRACKWLNDIKCLPLKTSGILNIFKSIKTSSLNLKTPLYEYNFNEFDTIRNVYDKYFEVMPKWDEPEVVNTYKEIFHKIFEDTEIGELGSNMMHLNDLKGEEFIAEAINVL
jgi:hypothetical protein